MTRIKSVNPISLATVTTLFFFVIGILVSASTIYRTYSVNKSANFLVIIAVILITYTISGLLLGLLGAILYNIIAKITGGIKVETESN